MAGRSWATQIGSERISGSSLVVREVLVAVVRVGESATRRGSRLRGSRFVYWTRGAFLVYVRVRVGAERRWVFGGGTDEARAECLFGVRVWVGECRMPWAPTLIRRVDSAALTLGRFVDAELRCSKGRVGVFTGPACCGGR